MSSRRTVLVSAYLLCAGFFYYITFVQFGLLTIARTRLGLLPTELPVAMGLLTVGGFAACLATSCWLERGGAARPARLRAIACCTAIEALLALLALAIGSPAHVTALCAALGIVLGANSVVTISLVFDGLDSRTRWVVCGGIVAVIYLGANVPPLVFARPERIVGFNALLAAFTAGVAWGSRRLPGIAQTTAPVPRYALRTWLPYLCAIVLLDSYTFQRLLSDETLWALTWGSDRHIWINGVVHALGAAGAGWLAQRTRGPQVVGTLAAASLIATYVLLLTRAAAIGGGYLLTVVYNVGVSAYFVLLLGLWPECCGRWPDVRLGWALALTCWLGAPTGIGLATLLPATPWVAFGAPLAAAVAAVVWLHFPRMVSPAAELHFAKETS